MSKKSTKQKVEEFFNKPLKEIMATHFKGIAIIENAIEKLGEITGGSIKPSAPPVFLKMVQDENLSETEYPFMKPQPKAHRGKEGIRSRLEREHSRGIWEILKEHANKQKDDAAKALGVSVMPLLKLVASGIDAREIEEATFAIWMQRKRNKKKTREQVNAVVDTDPSAKVLRFSLVCRHCGATHKGAIERMHVRGNGISDLALRAKRCKQCSKWGFFKGEVTVDGQKVRFQSTDPALHECFEIHVMEN
jgi:hypothetical protein